MSHDGLLFPRRDASRRIGARFFADQGVQGGRCDRRSQEDCGLEETYPLRRAIRQQERRQNDIRFIDERGTEARPGHRRRHQSLC